MNRVIVSILAITFLIFSSEFASLQDTMLTAHTMLTKRGNIE